MEHEPREDGESEEPREYLSTWMEFTKEDRADYLNRHLQRIFGEQLDESQCAEIAAAVAEVSLTGEADTTIGFLTTALLDAGVDDETVYAGIEELSA